MWCDDQEEFLTGRNGATGETRYGVNNIICTELVQLWRIRWLFLFFLSGKRNHANTPYCFRIKKYYYLGYKYFRLPVRISRMIFNLPFEWETNFIFLYHESSIEGKMYAYIFFPLHYTSRFYQRNILVVEIYRIYYHIDKGLFHK